MVELLQLPAAVTAVDEGDARDEGSPVEGGEDSAGVEKSESTSLSLAWCVSGGVADFIGEKRGSLGPGSDGGKKKKKWGC